MKRKACFLIPASPTSGFLAQIAAFSRAVRSLRWRGWEPSILAAFGGGCTAEALATIAEWQSHLKNVAIVFPVLSRNNTYYYDQIDGLFRHVPGDVDVAVRMDADTLPVSNLEAILDYVLARSGIAGTIAHYRFPCSRGNREAWSVLAAEFLPKPLEFNYSYSLTDANQPCDERCTPFYLNDGCVFISRRYLDEFVPLYLDLRPKLMQRLEQPYFAGQVALALAAAQIDLPAIALPLRYNFPNDQIAVLRYREELENACVIHYLRETEFQRDSIFQSAEHYAEFLAKPLNAANTKFRDCVRNLMGDIYPFDPGARDVDGVGAEAIPDGPIADEAASSVVEYIDQYRRTLALEPLMRAKQALTRRYGVREGYSRYRQLLSLPDSVPIRHLSLLGQSAYARKFAEHFVQTYAGGKPFRLKAMRVVGEGYCPEFSAVSRPAHVACLRDGIVRGTSAVLEMEYHALLEFEDEELDYFDCEFDIDPAIFSGDRHSAWVISGDAYPGRLEVDEAFTLLGPQLGAFGDFMMQYLPRYVWANLSGALPPVPVLVSEDIPATVEQALQMFLADQVAMIKVARLQTVRVRRLWCASNLTYAPAREVMDSRYSPAHTFPSPDLIVPVVRELRRRALPYLDASKAESRIYLGRRPDRWRVVTNGPEIEAIAERHGFRVVFPEDFDFVGQIQLVAKATHVVAPEGSALCLCYFARPGTKICILQHTIIEGTNVYDAFFDSCDITTLVGPITKAHPLFPHRADYLIDPERFDGFLTRWLDESGHRARGKVRN